MRLGFRPHLGVHQVPGEAVYLLSGRRVTALHGEQISRLAPLLDGTRDREQLIADAAGGLSAEQVVRLVDRLDSAGLLSLAPAPAPDTRAESGYWEAAGLSGPRAVADRAAATAAVLAVGGVDPAPLAAALAAAGVRTVTPGQHGPADLTLVLCEDHLDPRLRAVDAEHRAAGRPWLPVSSHGTEQWIGPFLGTGDGACWSCLAQQLWCGRQAEAHIQRSLGRTGPAPRPPFGLGAADRAGLQLAALEAVSWLAGHRHPGQRQLWTLDTLTLDGGRHPVPRRPQCPDCGDPGLMAAQVNAPVVLTAQPKRDTDGGGHRALTPDELMDRYGHLVDPLTGPVKELRRDRRGPAFLNSFHAGLNPAAGAGSIGIVRAALRGTSGGKGTTPERARAGALAEALERYSGFLQGDEPVVRGRYLDLADRAVSPDAVQLYDPRQFAGRERWNADCGPGHQVCDPFDERAEIDWTPVWSLTRRQHRLLPTSLLYYNVPETPGRRFCLSHSNGTAAGGTLEDALLQGVLELVERDAVALWWYNRTRQPGVDLDAFGDDWTRELRRVHAGLGREVWTLDLTADLGVPVFAAVSRRTDKAAEDLMFGFGAHLDPRTALRRALTELNQLLPDVVDARPDGTGYGRLDRTALDWLRTATTANQPYVTPDPARPATRPEDRPYLQRADLRDDLTDVQGRLEAAGLELLVLDQTRPDIGMPVVRVVVPGLRPHWRRLAPGRLFDVPVRLGRLAGPRAYQDLNPVPLFL